MYLFFGHSKRDWLLLWACRELQSSCGTILHSPPVTRTFWAGNKWSFITSFMIEHWLLLAILLTPWLSANAWCWNDTTPSNNVLLSIVLWAVTDTIHHLGSIAFLSTLTQGARALQTEQFAESKVPSGRLLSSFPPYISWPLVLAGHFFFSFELTGYQFLQKSELFLWLMALPCICFLTKHLHS